MSYDKLHDYDLEDYSTELQGAETTNEFGFIDVASDNFKNALMTGPTVGALELVQDTLNKFRDASPDDMISGAEANKTYGFEGTGAYKPEERVLIEEAFKRNERQFAERMSAAITETADSQGVMTGFAGVLGGLGGGFLEPVSIVGGTALGALARYLPWKALSLAQGHKYIRPYKSLIQSAKSLATTQGSMVNSLEAMVGAAAIDAPMMDYIVSKYGQEFKTKDYLMQIFAAGAFGATIPQLSKGIKYAASEAGQIFKNGMFKKFGSNTEEAVEELLHQTELASKLSAVPDENVTLKIQSVKDWSLREGQEGYTFSPAFFKEDIHTTDFYVGRRSGETSFREVSDFGTGTTTLIDHRALAHNSVQDINGKFDGEIKSVRPKSDTKILTQNEFLDDRLAVTAVIKSFKESIESAIRKNKSGKDLDETIAALHRVTHSMAAADNMADLHNIVAGSALSKHPEMYLNAAVRKEGYAGYHVIISDPLDEQFANGIVLIDAMGATEFERGNPTYDMISGMIDDDDLVTQDGIVSFFDETRFDVTNREGVPKADLNSDKMKSLRNEIGEIHKSELNRTTSPQGKIGYVQENHTDIEIADFLREDNIAAQIDAQKQILASLEAREDVPDNLLLSDSDKEFLAKTEERVGTKHNLVDDMSNCLRKP